MKIRLLATAVALIFAAISHGETSPIYGVGLTVGYRKWELIAPAREAAPLNELRVVVGNPLAVDA